MEQATNCKRSEMNVSVDFSDPDIYNYPNKATSGVLWTILLRRSIATLIDEGEAKGLSWLEIGSGGGWATEELAVHGANAVASDISIASCQCVKKRSHIKRFSASVVQCDAENLPFKDQAFDSVLINMSLHHFPSPAKALCESMRTSRNLYIVNEPCRDKFLNPIVKILGRLNARLKYVGAKAGATYNSIMDVDTNRLNVKEVRLFLENLGCSVEATRSWSYVPPFFAKIENQTLVSLYLVSLGFMNRFFACFGHSFSIKARRGIE